VVVGAQGLTIAWDELPPLPPSAGQGRQPGVAGPFAGVHRDVLIVAGGANFPDRMPWEGGAKVWWDDIWVLEKRAGASTRWVADRAFKLPRPLGYGISVSTPDGVVGAGGHDVERCHRDVFLLAWDPQTREIRRTALPPLPEPLTFMAGALVGQTLYVAGGQHVMKGAVPTSVFWALDLARGSRESKSAWRVLPAWPGPARILPVAAAQRTTRGEEFFLFGGRAPEAGRATRVLTDAYAFDPGSGTWRTLPNVGGGAGVSVMGAVAAPVGTDEIWLFGGDRGGLFTELEAHDLGLEELRQRLTTAPAAARPALERDMEIRLAAKRRIYETHPGFAREVLAFDVRRETWRVVGAMPHASPVTTVAVPWGDAVVIPSGEIAPGVRTPAVMRARPVAR
jgi:N-acetylneuraminic acid mutarotase